MTDAEGMKKRRSVLPWVALAMIAAITAGHYGTDMGEVAFHNVYRRLYYLPIVLAAFASGLRGGLLAAGVATLGYLPHAFFMEHHHDPAPAVDKVLEIVLYGAVGGLTGWLVERQRRVQRALEQSLEQRAQLEGQLVRAGKLSAMGELLAGLAHELRNPLASIMGAAEALAAEFDEGHRKHRLARLQLEEIERLDRVVSGFLAFARVTPPVREPLHLERLVQEVEELARHRTRGLEVRWRVEVDQSLQVQADEDQLRQVILNLVLNALQALEEAGAVDGQRPEIAFVTGRREVGGVDHLCLGVQDNGPGVDPASRESIFDPYVTTRATGTGLGLSISSRIVESHGGFLDVESEPGRTIFWVCLPEQDGAQRRRRR